MALRFRRVGGDVESGLLSAAEVADIQNRNVELETLTTSLKKLLEVSRRREKKLLKIVEDLNPDQLVNLDMNDEGGVEDVRLEESFLRSMLDRTSWLIGLLLFQSASSYILRYNESLLQRYPVIVYFLTMLVGAGGNAGNQSAVRVIRGLAVGTLNTHHLGNLVTYLSKEIAMAFVVGSCLGVVGLGRVAYLSATPWPEAFAISFALFVIVVSSIIIGAILPMLFNIMGIDPAHASTTIQVIMDISGVLITCTVAAAVLEGSLMPAAIIDAGSATTTGTAGGYQQQLPQHQPSPVPFMKRNNHLGGY